MRMSITNSSGTFDTEDFGQAIAISARGHQLIRLERNEKTKRVTFCFQRSEGIDQAALDYWSGNLLVDAKRYWDESRALKARLYGTKRDADQ
jgi:hypothetical protein